MARAVVGYCDGKLTRTFVGETKGTIAKEPAGQRRLYWDVVFSRTAAAARHMPKLRWTPLALSESSLFSVNGSDQRVYDVPVLANW